MDYPCPICAVLTDDHCEDCTLANQLKKAEAKLRRTETRLRKTEAEKANLQREIAGIKATRIKKARQRSYAGLTPIDRIRRFFRMSRTNVASAAEIARDIDLAVGMVVILIEKMSDIKRVEEASEDGYTAALYSMR